ncbi:MAG: serine/threonine-protein kinase RsbW [Solirubrobacteraceae bacterium]|jgi:serine/threonine-protein kinase RsbW/stage II sporulation protein AB (anti-sigma F factor)|nr:serine/threonine-protein kinase RsbW [Solirubrobacteraceae bacterium]
MRHLARVGLGCSETRPAVPEAVAALRAIIVEFATRVGLAQSTIDNVKLAVSEAATNVVVHAYRGAREPGPIHLEATLEEGELRVSIADDGSGMRPEDDSPGLGLGLAIIAQLVDDFELLQRRNGGLRVLMRFAPPATPAPS